jgi:large subunit ribosomal protein L9
LSVALFHDKIAPLEALYPSSQNNPLGKGLIKMKVLLIKDVYKLGHAGDIKKVADGYGRNFLLPQGLAVLATAGSTKSAEHIRAKAAATREILNSELKGVADQIRGIVLTFNSKAGETGKLYGSITTQMIADAVTKQIGAAIDRRQIESQPIRVLGEHKARVRLTVDLVPEIKINVLREGETGEPKEETKAPRKSTRTAKKPIEEVKAEAPAEQPAGTPAETKVDEAETKTE